MRLRRLPVWWLVVPILLLSSAFVSSNFNLLLIHNDEQNSIRHLYFQGKQHSLDQTIRSVNQTSRLHVPGYYMLLWAWAQLVGIHFVMLRVLTLFIFAISVAMIYRFGHDLFNPRVAICASFIVGFSGYYIYAGHNIRFYPLLILEIIGLLWAYWRIVVSAKSTRWYHWLGLFSWSVAGMYTQSLFIFPLLAIGVYHLVWAPKNRLWLRVIIAEVLAGVAFLPWIPSALDGTTTMGDLGGTYQNSLEIIFNVAVIYSNGFWVGAILLTGIVAWRFPRKNTSLQYVVIIFTTILVFLLVANEILLYMPVRRLRYSMILLPPLAVIWGLGLTLLYKRQKLIFYGVLAGWLIMLAWYSASDEFLVTSNHKTVESDEWFPFDTVGNIMLNQYQDFLSSDDRLVFFDPTFSYADRFLGYYEAIYQQRYEVLTIPITEQHIAQLNKIDNSFPGFWFSYQTKDEDALLVWQNHKSVQSAFDLYHPCIQALDTPEIRLSYYLDVRVPCDLITASNQQAIKFNNGYRLRNSVVEYRESEVTVSLWWDSIPEFIFDNSFGFSIQVFRDNDKVGQTDYPVDNVVTHNVVTLSNATAGIYSVRMILYSTEDVKSVGGERGTGVIFERDVEIGSFAIVDTD